MADYSRKRPSPPHGNEPYGQKYARSEYGGYGQSGPQGQYERRNLLPPGGQSQLDRCVSNYFNIQLDKPLRVFVYPVSADSFSDLSTKLRQRFINTFLRNYAFPGSEMRENNDRIISDVTTVVTTVEIPAERLKEQTITVGDIVRRIQLLAPRVVDLKTTADLSEPTSIESSIYNLILQKSLRKFLDRTPRGYFERVASDELPGKLAEGVRLFRGYSATISVKNGVQGRSLMFNVDPLCRVIGLDSVLAEMQRAIGGRSFESLSTQEKGRLRRMLIGRSVHTRYNSKAYIIEEVDFSKNPFDYKFEMSGRGGETQMMSPAQYLREYQSEMRTDGYGRKYKVNVDTTQQSQPLIRTRGRGKKSIYLVPEHLCFIEVPKKIKDELPKICSIPPTNRFKLTKRLAELVTGEGAARRVLESFNLRIDSTPILVRARQLNSLPAFDMYGRTIPTDKAWGPATKDLRFPSTGLPTVNLHSVFIVTEPGREGAVQQLYDDCARFFGQWNSPVRLPHQRFVVTVPDGSDPYSTLMNFPPMQQYLNAANSAADPVHSLVFGVLYGRDHPEKYKRIREFCAEYGVLEQVINGEKYNAARAQVVVKANVAKQILNKLGYFVWQADFATILQPQITALGLSTMKVLVIGIDVHHARKIYDDQKSLYRQRRSLGAFVAFMYELKAGEKRPISVKVYSDVVAKEARSEIIAKNIGGSEASSSAGEESDTGEDLEAPSITSSSALQAFAQAAMESARFYPHLLVVYRDGVADSQMEQARAEEVQQVHNAVETVKAKAGMPWSSQIIFNVIQKNITTKFGIDQFGDLRSVLNLPSGTVIDGDIRDPNYLDWFLVSSREREERGVAATTVKPVRYVVLRNDASGAPLNLSPEQFQTFTYALHGIYPNWTDFVKLPVVTQCAHKFAKTFGDIDLLQPRIHPRLKNTLFFL
eukprot:TRINITY_DN6291_c0_g1_i1.p1 TRINITY_DN6291_c0_g1~~TRINITY_DN6291_c0_g1_i1.p1  ORF type:complete len:956 (-),score=186.82 TRINITY_DN6291_c0_g1_i1:102-2897(-)